jgi:hypothetical protein
LCNNEVCAIFAVPLYLCYFAVTLFARRFLFLRYCNCGDALYGGALYGGALCAVLAFAVPQLCGDALCAVLPFAQYRNFAVTLFVRRFLFLRYCNFAVLAFAVPQLCAVTQLR